MSTDNKWTPVEGDRLRHKNLRWVVTIMEIDDAWVTVETGLGHIRVQSLSHILKYYEKEN
jgi:hypothetical protein